jgi:Domain of unknown function (DU1801)
LLLIEWRATIWQERESGYRPMSCGLFGIGPLHDERSHVNHSYLTMQSKASTVEQYLSELPEDRRRALKAVRQVILENLDKDYEEGMQYGMIGYYVPHRVYPPGYHCDPKQPLPFAGLASQKNYMSLYLMSVYAHQDNLKSFQQAWAKTGKKLDMGKACVRFKKLDDLALDVIAEAIRSVPAKAYVDFCEASLKANREKAPAARSKVSRSTGSPKSPKSANPARKTSRGVK